MHALSFSLLFSVRKKRHRQHHEVDRRENCACGCRQVDEGRIGHSGQFSRIREDVLGCRQRHENDHRENCASCCRQDDEGRIGHSDQFNRICEDVLGCRRHHEVDRRENGAIYHRQVDEVRIGRTGHGQFNRIHKDAPAQNHYSVDEEDVYEEILSNPAANGRDNCEKERAKRHHYATPNNVRAPRPKTRT